MAMQHPKTWAIHFEFRLAQGHLAGLYGFKSLEEAQPVISYLENNSEITSLAYDCTWKETKKSPWRKEQTIVRAEGKWKFE